MLTAPEKLRLPTAGTADAFIVVNWNEAARGEYVKIIVDGREAVVPRAALVRAVLLVGSDDEQMDIIPTKQIRIRHYKKNVVLQLKKDMKAGEFIRTSVSMDLPYDETTPRDGIILSR